MPNNVLPNNYQSLTALITAILLAGFIYAHTQNNAKCGSRLNYGSELFSSPFFLDEATT